jgi:hypothetical protein
MRLLPDARSGGRKSKVLHLPVVALAHRLVPGMEDLPEGAGKQRPASAAGLKFARGLNGIGITGKWEGCFSILFSGGMPMLARMRENLLAFWKQTFISALPLLPWRSAEEQTKETWAVWIKSFAEVPEAYRDFFAAFLAQGHPFPYTLLTPGYERFLRKTTEKLICEIGGDIYILEKSGQGFEVRCYPLDSLDTIEFSRMLLDASLTLHGQEGPEGPASSMLQFNSVTDYLFTPLIWRMRGAAEGSQAEARHPLNEQFEHWGPGRLKFINFARRSLLPDEEPVGAILQPEIRGRLFPLAWKTWQRTLSPAHMAILTDRELILFREKVWPGAIDRYGGIWDYIPRNKIKALSLKRKAGDLLELSIHLSHQRHLEILFQAALEAEVEQFLQPFQGIRLSPDAPRPHTSHGPHFWH